MSDVIKCYKCNGKGHTGIEVNPLVGVLTLGWGFLADTSEDCNACKGKGYIIIKDEDDEE